MDMQKMWNAYAQECRVLRERIAALRQALEDEKLMPMERHELDRRKRLLSEEARDLEWSMRSIAVYAAQEKAGDAVCAGPPEPHGKRCCFRRISGWNAGKNSVSLV